MNYGKPEVTVLGYAKGVIEILVKPHGRQTDGPKSDGPAYDLDE